jgi:hypothetical protein
VIVKIFKYIGTLTLVIIKILEDINILSQFRRNCVPHSTPTDVIDFMAGRFNLRAGAVEC